MYMILVRSWLCKNSQKRHQFYRLVSFAQSTDIHMSGSAVKKHGWPKNGKNIICKIENFAPLVVPGRSSASGSSSCSTSRMQDTTPSESQDPDKTRSDSLASGNRDGTDSDKMERDDQSQAVPEWLQTFTENLEDPEIPVPALIFYRRLRFGTFYKGIEKIKIKEALYLYSLPKDPELRRVLEDQNYEVSLQKTRWRSIYSMSRKVWWLDHGGCQSPQRGRWINLETITGTLSWYKILPLNGFNLIREKIMRRRKKLRKFPEPSERWISEQSPIRCRGTRSCHSMDSVLPVQNLNFSGNGKEFTKVSRTVTKAKSYLHRQFIGVWQILWRILMESSNFDTSSIRDKQCCWESGAENKRRNLSCTVTIRLGWKMVGGFYGMLLLSAKMFKTSWQMGKLPVKDDSENHSKGAIFPFGVMVEYHPISARDQSILHQFGKKVLPGIFLGCALIAGENLERGYSDCRNWGTTQVGRIRNYPRRINAKEGMIPQKGEESKFPVADGTAKVSGSDYEFREPTQRREQVVRREKSQRRISRRTGRVSTCRTKKDDAEARTDFWSIQGDFIYRHHNEPRVQLHVPKEETFSIPLKCVDVTRSAHTDLEVKQEKRIDDYWNVDLNRSLSDTWKGFTKFTVLKEKPPKQYMWSGVETDKSSNDYKTKSRVAWGMVPNWKNRSESRKTRMGSWQTQIGQCSTKFYWSKWWRISRDNEECKEKAGNTNGTRYA